MFENACLIPMMSTEKRSRNDNLLSTRNEKCIAKTAYDWSNTATWTVSYTALQIDWLNWLITLDKPYTRLRANYKTAKLINHIDSNEDDYWPACQLNISHQRRFFFS